MKISAQVKSSEGSHEVYLRTNDQAHSIDIPPKANGFGSSANGGELLFLALATCYCNDVYREAAKRNINVRNVQVEVSGEFSDAPGSCAENITYKAIVEAEASEAAILDLMRHTDTVAEIQNTLRQGVSVRLDSAKAISVVAD
ncbi:MAG: OsmC family protein [Chloroflexi bacterium]|nr:OsmC family protein [Chloroflexota bacterium]